MVISRWLTGFAAVSVVVPCGRQGEREARAERQIGSICEEWRDYYFSVETGEFLGWAGEPYWYCYSWDEPLSRPESPAPDDYGGGWGFPRDRTEQRCSECGTSYERCTSRVQRGHERCLEHYRAQMREYCVRTMRKRFGRPIEGDYACEHIEDPSGKPVLTCHGPAIDDCVESFAQDQPEVTIENHSRVNVGQNWWGLGSDQTSTVRWGGIEGFISGCERAWEEALNICLARQDTCEEEAGGCR